MDPTKLRNTLNGLAAALGALSAGLLAAGLYPEVAKVIGLFVTFLLGWANLTRPGDVSVPKGAMVQTIAADEGRAGSKLVSIIAPGAPREEEVTFSPPLQDEPPPTPAPPTIGGEGKA